MADGAGLEISRDDFSLRVVAPDEPLLLLRVCPPYDDPTGLSITDFAFGPDPDAARQALALVASETAFPSSGMVVTLTNILPVSAGAGDPGRGEVEARRDRLLSVFGAFLEPFGLEPDAPRLRRELGQTHLSFTIAEAPCR